jgi:outer membrane protein assembly factor BamA
MKKLILIFFILFSYDLCAEKIFLSSEFFSSKNELMELIEENLKNKFKLESKINDYFMRNGYEFTKVEEIFTRKKKDEIHIILDEGRIREFIIAGNDRISYRLITTYLYFKKGDIFNKNKLRLQIKKMYQTGLYDLIEYRIMKSRKYIVVNVIERKKSFFNLNGSASSQYGIIPYVGYTKRNIFGTDYDMNINGDVGIYDRISFYQLNLNFRAKNNYFNYTHREGLTYINEDTYSSVKENAQIGYHLSYSKNYHFSIQTPLEYYYFTEHEQFNNLNVINKFRYGLALVFSYDNKRDVLDEREETHFDMCLSSMYFNTLKNYSKFDTDFKWYKKLYYYSAMIYRNNLGVITGTLPFDKLYMVGGWNLRGYPEGTYLTKQIFNNSIEIEREILFRLLRLIVFADTSYLHHSRNNYKFLVSYGTGVMLKAFNLRISAYYGVPTSKPPLHGLFYLSLQRIFY